MTRVQRYDAHRFDAIEELPSGALRIQARIARVGVLDYEGSDGSKWGELVPAETLFDEGSMATAQGMGVCDLHPGQPVTPETFASLARGHVGDDVKPDGEFLAAPVYVSDAAEIALVKKGERKDCSAAYTTDLDETPGVFQGKPYKAIQRNRIYNHLGLGPEGWGRAGADVSLRLDGGGAVCRLDAPQARADGKPGAKSPMENAMTTKRKDEGGEVKEPTATDPSDTKKDSEPEMVPKKDADAAMAALEAKHVKMIETLEGLVKDLTKQLAELKAGEESEITEEEVPPKVADSIVSKRLGQLDSAREGARLVAPAVKLDGLLKPREIHAAAIAVALPTVKLDGLPDATIEGMFLALVEPAKDKAAKHADGGRQIASVLSPTAKQGEEAARQDAAGNKPFDPIEFQRAAMQARNPGASIVTTTRKES